MGDAVSQTVARPPTTSSLQKSRTHLISRWLPTRAGRDLVVTATTGVALPGTTLLVLGGWTLLTGSLALWAYRRDEGRRFR